MDVKMNILSETFGFLCPFDLFSQLKEIQKMVWFVLKFIIPVRGSHYGFLLQTAIPLTAYNGLMV